MKFKIIIVLVFSLIVTSCNTDYKLRLNTPKKLDKSHKFDLNLTEENGKVIDSVLYFINGKKTSKSIDLSKEKLGNYEISALAFFGNKSQKITENVVKYAAQSPVVYNYEIINEFPHDANAFTQGLEFHNGFLYESTGRYKKSSIRKVALETGKVIERKDLDKTTFGEGMTIFNDKLHVLSWKKYKGYTYNLSDFSYESDFSYGKSTEGWGLTHNDTHIIKSDGTEKIWFLNPTTLKEEYHIEAYTNKRNRDQLNELEFVEGQIFANVWQNNIVVMINPKSGAIEGFINLNGLQKLAGQTGADNVLNGIAYDAKNKRLFVTGKLWNKVFEIKFSKKQ